MDKTLFRGGFLVKSFFYEKPNGVDFSMRQKNKGIKTNGNNGYALTQRKSFDNIMKRITITDSDSFIDIGCGKGGVLLHATKYPFKRIAGLEIEDSLYKIAASNFERLKMHTIEVFHDDAITFDRYGEFNVFFLFNPFEPEIYQKVIENVCRTLNEKRSNPYAYLICYGATITDYIKKKNIFEMIDEFTDDIRGTGVVIWRWERAW